MSKNQKPLVQIFNDKLKKSLENHTHLLLPLQRFIELSEEIESKNTTKERRNDCKNNLEVYKDKICCYLRKNFDSGVHENKIHEATNKENKTKSECKKSFNEDLKDLLNEFECPVCFENYTSPKLLSCGHTFCADPCLKRILDRQRNKIKCPTCR